MVINHNMSAVFANNQLEPNTLFVLPADAIANTIVKELFP